MAGYPPQVPEPQRQALLSRVQRFSLHDGPGIRTTVFFKGCPLRCRWCQNPETLRPHAEIAFSAERCRGDGACARACPREAIAPGPDRVVRARCDACGRCVEACAFGALERVGRAVTAAELLAEVARDRKFYEASGGGVTLSGGEPTLQMEFLGAFARACAGDGIRLALQTCGAFLWESFAQHLPLFELILFDLKLADPTDHRRETGAGSATIHDNARRLVEAGAKVRFRVPVVPGITDTEANLRGLAALLRGLGVGAVDLLSYHRLGEAKLPRLGFPLATLGIDPTAAAPAVAAARSLLRREGLEVSP